MYQISVKQLLLVRRCRLSALLLFFLLSLAVSGQKITITGKAPGAERKFLQLTTPSDLITQWDNHLASVKIDSSGKFRMEIESDRVILATFSIEFHKADLLLEPGKTYLLDIAPMNYDEFTEINPFIQSQNLTIGTGDDSPAELNNLIGRFNTYYSGFLMENFNALYRDKNKVLLDTFRIRLNRLFGEYQHPYFIDYATYKIAGLEQLTQYYSNTQIAKKYFSASPVLYNNLEYMEFFNNFFSKYFSAISPVLRKTDFSSLLASSDPYVAVMKAMAADTLLKSEQLRELVMLKGMFEIYGNTAYDPAKILALMTLTKEKSKYPDNRLVAGNMVKHLTNLKPGTTAPDFIITGMDQRDFSSVALHGKPLLLFFWTSYCDGCLSEMDLLPSLYAQYGDRIQFVGVSADKFFAKMLFVLNQKKEYTWTFLNVGSRSEILTAYDVRTYPLFVLIDKDWKIVQYAAPLPSEDLGSAIEKLLEK